MVTYTEQAAYRHRNRNRRVVVLEGTFESGESSSVPLQASNASINSIDSVDFETTVVNGSILSYNATSDEVELFDQDLTSGTTDQDGNTFRVKVVGPEE